MKEWYVETADGVTGPLSPSELASWIKQGRLQQGHRVSYDRATWLPADAVRGLLGDSGQATVLTLQGTVQEGKPDFPGYEVLGVLGSGGGGVVYKARQLKLGRLVALKTVPVNRASTETFLKRFRQEAEVLARLSHPNIVPVFDCDCAEGGAWYAMELLAGEDLDARIQRTGPLGEREAWMIARQAAAALAYAAREGVYHRDVKPSNLFLVPSQSVMGLPGDVPLVKVTDFGLALTRQAVAEGPDSRLTAAGVVLGTPAYMAPEQARSPQVDHRADIYSLGATLYHALSGSPPFSGATIWDIVGQKSRSPRLGPPASPETAELVAAMMAVEPEARVGSYEELLLRIGALPVMREMAAVPPPRPEPRRGAWWWLVAGAVLLALAYGGWLAWNWRRAPPAAYEATGTSEQLINERNVLPWAPTGGAWSMETDEEEGTRVLAGEGGVRRTFRPYLPDFQVTVGLDLHGAQACELALEGPASDVVLRISRDEGAVAGRWVGKRERFEPVGRPVPLPSARALKDRAPYLAVQFRQAGGRRAILFHGSEVAEFAAEGAREAALSLATEGGPVRVDSVLHEELRVAEKK